MASSKGVLIGLHLTFKTAKVSLLWWPFLDERNVPGGMLCFLWLNHVFGISWSRDWCGHVIVFVIASKYISLRLFFDYNSTTTRQRIGVDRNVSTSSIEPKSILTRLICWRV